MTPLSDRDTLDCDGLEHLLNHVLDGGVNGVFILGTTGEAPSLSYRLRREVVERTCSMVGGRVPVLVGITDTSAVESLRLAGHVSDCGAHALVTGMPYYYPTNQSEVLQYIRKIVPQLPLPVFLYNMPAMTKSALEIATLRKLVDLENICGLKDSSGDLSYFQKLLDWKQLRADWKVFSGTESQLIASVKSGGDGGVCGGANLFPRLFLEAWQASSVGDFHRAGELQEKIEVLQGIYCVEDSGLRHVKATKCALSLNGICNDLMAFPSTGLNPEERARLMRVLDSMSQSGAID